MDLDLWDCTGSLQDRSRSLDCIGSLQVDLDLWDCIGSLQDGSRSLGLYWKFARQI